MTNCKICKSEKILHLEEIETISFKGNSLEISMEYSICQNCEREFVSKQQIMNNDARIRDAKKHFDGLMTSTEILDARTTLGLTQEQASLVFGGGKNAFSKYERAEVSQSAAMDRLIKICLKHPNVFKELLKSAKVKISDGQIAYEDNILHYSKIKAANQDSYKQKKTIQVMREPAYG
jgi:HTH-type transcriptional regulator/antitoxin MqsA